MLIYNMIHHAVELMMILIGYILSVVLMLICNMLHHVSGVNVSMYNVRCHINCVNINN